MLTLGIETSGHAGSVALIRDGDVLVETSLELTGRRHARTLVTELQSLWARVGLRPAECEVVAVSIGPGSFTGLRVGVVCAKTFAYATGCRVVAVDTLETIAARAPGDVHDVLSLVDAMRGDVFHGHYRRACDRWVRSGGIGLSAWKTLAAPPDVGVALTGPALIAIPPDQWPAPRLPEHLWQPTAAAVARIGEREALAGHTQDLWTLEPLYIRKSARGGAGGAGERRSTLI